MKQEIVVQNLKCGGCAVTIRKGLSEIEGVENVQVEVESSTITLDAEVDKTTEIHEKLSKMGYPASDDPNSILKQAKSFVSCAVGRMTDDEKE